MELSDSESADKFSAEGMAGLNQNSDDELASLFIHPMEDGNDDEVLEEDELILNASSEDSIDLEWQSLPEEMDAKHVEVAEDENNMLVKLGLDPSKENVKPREELLVMIDTLQMPLVPLPPMSYQL